MVEARTLFERIRSIRPRFGRRETCSEIEQYVIHERRLVFRDPLAEVG
jgi:hypothetical protein